MPKTRVPDVCRLLLIAAALWCSPAAGAAQEPADAAIDSLRLPVPLPVVQAPHARGGRALAFMFGDSTDHLRHNIGNLFIGSTATMAVLWILPESYTYWYRDTPPLQRLVDAYTKPPEWDRDPWYFNYIGHPIAGMHVYLLERNWGKGQWHSFLFATAASVGWEYGFEAFMERPSIQDLLITSPSGWLLGEAAYRLTMLMRKNGFSLPEKGIMLILNPLYVMQHGYR